MSFLKYSILCSLFVVSNVAIATDPQPNKQLVPCLSISVVQKSGNYLDGYERFKTPNGYVDIVFTKTIGFLQNKKLWQVNVRIAPAKSEQEAKRLAKIIVANINTMKSEFAEEDSRLPGASICYYGEMNEVITIGINPPSAQLKYNDGWVPR